MKHESIYCLMWKLEWFSLGTNYWFGSGCSVVSGMTLFGKNIATTKYTTKTHTTRTFSEEYTSLYLRQDGLGLVRQNSSQRWAR